MVCPENWPNASLLAAESRSSTGLPNPNPLDSLVLIKPGSFGDVIHTLPCAAAIKKHRPQLHLTWLVDERWRPLLADNPHVDRTIVFPRQKFRGLTGKLSAIPWAASLRQLRPHTALDLQGLLRSALMARLCRAQHTIGLDDAREGAWFCYHQTIPVDRTEHAVTRYLRCLPALGLPTEPSPEFWLPAGSRPAAFTDDAPYILLHPFARGSGKSLRPAQVTFLSKNLAPHRVVLAGAGEYPPDLPPNSLNLLAKTSIAELIWLIRHAAYVISVDSGPMHIAAAVNTPMLSIHTWSDPRLVGPFNTRAHVWQGGEIRTQNLTAPNLPPPKQPAENDLSAIATHVKSLLSST